MTPSDLAAMLAMNYSGFSGGKDSTALGLWLIHESGYARDTLRFTFCDTGNEHPITYDYLRMLSEKFKAWGAPEILWLKPKRDFWELAAWKQRFPSTKARFCTQHLKTFVTREDLNQFLKTHEVLLHSGIRGGESADRAKKVEREIDLGFGCMVYRPLLKWSLQNVWDYLKRFGIPKNQLYDLGASRVGCCPCIMSRKKEIAMIAEKFPDRIDNIRDQELKLGSTFFGPRITPRRFRSLKIITKKGATVFVPTIDDVVEWSKTGKGARGETGQQMMQLNDKNVIACDTIGSCE